MMAQWGQWLLLAGAIVRGVIAVYVLLMANQFLRIVSDLAQQGGTTPEDELFWIIAIVVSALVATSILGFLAWHQARNGDARRAGILGIVLGVVSLVDPFLLVGGILVLAADKRDSAAFGEVMVKPTS